MLEATNTVLKRKIKLEKLQGTLFSLFKKNKLSAKKIQKIKVSYFQKKHNIDKRSEKKPLEICIKNLTSYVDKYDKPDLYNFLRVFADLPNLSFDSLQTTFQKNVKTKGELNISDDLLIELIEKCKFRKAKSYLARAILTRVLIERDPHQRIQDRMLDLLRLIDEDTERKILENIHEKEGFSHFDQSPQNYFKMVINGYYGQEKPVNMEQDQQYLLREDLHRYGSRNITHKVKGKRLHSSALRDYTNYGLNKKKINFFEYSRKALTIETIDEQLFDEELKNKIIENAHLGKRIKQRKQLQLDRLINAKYGLATRGNHIFDKRQTRRKQFKKGRKTEIHGDDQLTLQLLNKGAPVAICGFNVNDGKISITQLQAVVPYKKEDPQAREHPRVLFSYERQKIFIDFLYHICQLSGAQELEILCAKNSTRVKNGNRKLASAEKVYDIFVETHYPEYKKSKKGDFVFPLEYTAKPALLSQRQKKEQ